jgi:hypothetical protein
MAAAALLMATAARAIAFAADPPAWVSAPDTAPLARDSAASTGRFEIGAAVADRSGALIGHLTRLTTDAKGRSVAKVRSGEDVYSVPVSDLFMRDGVVLSTVSLDDLKQGRIR